MGDEWNFCSLCFLVPSALYNAWGYRGRNGSVGVVFNGSKTEKKHEELFAALKTLNAMLDPQNVIFDFQIAAIEALKSKYPNANIKSFLYHLAQANWPEIDNWIGISIRRKLRRLNLSEVSPRSYNNPGIGHLQWIWKF